MHALPSLNPIDHLANEALGRLLQPPRKIPRKTGDLLPDFFRRP
jgi:hypothetical protein